MTQRTRAATFAIAFLFAIMAHAGNVSGPTDPAIQATARGSNEFAIDLYRQLRADEGNLFFSPYSIQSAMAMAHAGAGGDTAAEIASTLKLPHLSPPELDAALAGLSRCLCGDVANNGYELQIASAMWGQIGNAFSLSYINRLRVNFGAALIGLDFSDPQVAAATINQWVSNKTNGLITKLIDPAALNDQTSLVLTNAIYFKGTWIEAFGATRTCEEPWNDGDTAHAPESPPNHATVKMMFQTAAFDYVDGPDSSALKMPYLGGDLSMLVLLPHDPARLGDLEKTLTLSKLKSIISALHREPEVNVWFPKFKLEAEFDLRQTLMKMGMPAAFSNTADFSGINGRRNLLLTDLVHKAFVCVDETGTEAAAATGVGFAGGGPPPPPLPAFRADHPFIFVIMDLKAGTILFMGRVIHPPQ